MGSEHRSCSVLDVSPFTPSAGASTEGHGGALAESIAFNRRVVGSTPALAAM